MSNSTHVYRQYDHRVRNMIAMTKNPDLYPDLKIPKSTARSWIKAGKKSVVTIPEFELSNETLLQRVSTLERELNLYRAKSNLTSKMIKILGLTSKYARFPSKVMKEMIIERVSEAIKVIPLKECLAMIGLSTTRLRAG